MTVTHDSRTLAPLRYRLAVEADVPRLLELWTAHSGWGPITLTQWRSWYEDAPCGPALIAVAEDVEARLVGMNVFLPCQIRVGGQTVSGVRPSAPILHHSVRMSSASAAETPATILYLAAAGAAADRGHAVIYTLPDNRWVPFMTRAARTLAGIPRHRTSFGCLSLDLSVHEGRQPAGLRAAASTMFGPELGLLWQQAVRHQPIACAVERTPAWLTYKHRGEVRIEVHGRNGALVGFVAIGTRRAALTNAFSATPDDLPAVLEAAVAWLAAAYRAGDPSVPRTIAALDHGPCGQALRALGFAPIAYRFGFIADTLDESRVPLAAVEPSAWYLTSGD